MSLTVHRRADAPLETEPWDERYFQVSDPNGVVYQFVQWMTTDGG